MAVATTTLPTITFSFKKETKGTYVYASDAADAPVTQIYVRKDALPQGAPATITVTITV